MDSESPKKSTLERTLAALLLRLWLGLRSFQAGIEKFAGTQTTSSATLIDGQPNAYGLETAGSEKTYSLDNYSGVPSALMEKFENEPLIPESMLGLYDTILGPTLIILGILLLLGIASRLSLFAMGLIYTSLTFGLILINQSAGVASLKPSDTMS